MTFRDDLSFGKSGDSKMPRGKERKGKQRSLAGLEALYNGQLLNFFITDKNRHNTK